MWKWKKEETTITYRGGGNYAPPPMPRATDQELADAADYFTDLTTEALNCLEVVKKFILDQNVEDNKDPINSWAGHFPRFPVIGGSILDNIIKAQAEIIEANRAVAVQGYSVKRRIESNDDPS